MNDNTINLVIALFVLFAIVVYVDGFKPRKWFKVVTLPFYQLRYVLKEDYGLVYRVNYLKECREEIGRIDKTYESYEIAGLVITLWEMECDLRTYCESKEHLGLSKFTEIMEELKAIDTEALGENLTREQQRVLHLTYSAFFKGHD